MNGRSAIHHPPSATREGTPSARWFRVSGLWLLLAILATGSCGASAPGAGEGDSPRSPREFYNDGTQRFREGKLREAEASLQTAVAGDDERVQPPALYNLGEVRFQQGQEALKQAPEGHAVQARSDAALGLADQAINVARTALAGEDLGAVVRAYLLGRGARRELKAATEAVKKALTAHGAVLSKWQRASGDFKSAFELQRGLDDARFNADVVDRHIAALVDQQQMMMMAMQGMGEKRQELNGLLKKLKGRVPGGTLPKAPGDDDEDEDEDDNGDQKPPPKPEAGQQEKEAKAGREMALTPEEAMRLLESLKLDANRKLPMGDQETAPPRDLKRRDW